MNSRYNHCPEIISSTLELTAEGEEIRQGDSVTGISVSAERGQPAIAQIEIREFRKGRNLTVEIELSELVAALSLATLNADKTDES